MKINRSIVLFLVTVNAALVLFDIWHFITFHETVFKNFKSAVKYSSWTYYYMTLAFLGLAENVILFGLYWVLRVFKDRRWIRVTVLLTFIGKIGIILFALFLQLRYKLTGSMSIRGIGIPLSISYFFITAMLIGFLFVRTKAIKRHYIGIAILMTIGYLYPKIEGLLYNNFGKAWLLVNQDFLVKLPFVISLILFIDVFNLSQKQQSEALKGEIAIVEADQQTTRSA